MCLVCSSTPPVLEVLKHDHSALLVDFFDVSAQVSAVDKLLTDRQLANRLSSAARETSMRYSPTIGLPGWLSHIGC